MKKVRGPLALAAATSIGLTGAVGATASPASTAEPSVLQLDGMGSPQLSNAEIFDIERVAQEKGISMDAAISELGGQDDFARFATAISEEFPHSFAYARFDAGTGVLGLKATLDPAVTDMALRLPVDVQVVQRVGWSEREIRASGEALHFAVRAASPDTEVHTDIDSEAGQIKVTVDAPLGALTRPMARIADNRAVTTASSQVPVGVEVSINSGKVSDGFDTVYGGGHLSTCTSAFSVRSSSYANGLLTAEHCGNTQAYSGRKVLTFRGALGKSKGDVQWHSSSETAAASFYYTSGSRRAITATANAVPGQSLCKYGKTTSNTCDEVYKTGQCRGDYCNLVMTHRRKADSGDSGGPWFWGNTGYGIHSGWKKHLLINRDMFTPVRSAASTLGLTVNVQ